MSELSPQAEANDMELATTKGRPHVAARGRTVRARPWLPPCGGAVERSETEGGIRRLSCSDRRGVSPFRPSVRTGAPPPQGRRPFVGRDDPGAPNFPLQGKVARPKAVTDEGATDRFVLGGHTGPPLRAETDQNFVGAAPCGRPRADEADSPYQGEMSSEARQKG